MTQKIWTDELRSKSLIVIGSGGHAGVLIDTLKEIGANILFITEREPSRKGTEVRGVRIAGDDKLIEEHAADSVLLVNGIGSADSLEFRQRIRTAWLQKGYQFATVVHPSATISKFASVLPGAQIMAGVVIQGGTTIGRASIVNTSACIDHDCQIGDCVQISPGVTLCGNVIIDEQSHIGAGATVIQGVHIGRQVLVGAGSVVLHNIAEGQAVVGNPARPLIRKTNRH